MNIAYNQGEKPNIKCFRNILNFVLPPNKKLPTSNGYFEKFKNRNRNVLFCLKTENEPEVMNLVSMNSSAISSSPKLDFIEFDSSFELNEEKEYFMKSSIVTDDIDLFINTSYDGDSQKSHDF